MEKVRILGFLDKEFQTQSGACEVVVNPDMLRFKERDFQVNEEGANVAHSYKSEEPKTLSITFILDETGSSSQTTDVARSIKDFKDVAYDYHGQIHSPNYLKVIWGAQVFNCMLVSLNISYVLFDPKGKPLRAKLSVRFIEHQTVKNLARKSTQKSADLTHTRPISD